MELQGKVPLNGPNESLPIPVRRPEPSAGYVAWGLGLTLGGGVIMAVAFGTAFAAAGAIAVIVGTVGLVMGAYNFARNVDTMTAISYNEAHTIRKAPTPPR
ncbi:hypothetical protein [Isoptericola sp. QY 916]|uniref:hypothetical protein n=1 Tax=Isoptericola sp. QY 916 TaxID=2782570 RepID=UPI003D2FFCC3|nr:hypothetical protein [Isoptericola sp. QY 916]